MNVSRYLGTCSFLDPCWYELFCLFGGGEYPGKVRDIGIETFCIWKSYTTEFWLPGLQEPSTGPCSELYDWSMPSHRIVSRFSWIFSCCLCLCLPSGVLIWGHCVLEIQYVIVCLYWNYYYVVTSRTVFLGGFTQFHENVIHYACDD